MDTKTQLIIYYASFHSIISYGIVLCGGAGKSILDTKKIIQNRLIKIINKKYLCTII